MDAVLLKSGIQRYRFDIGLIFPLSFERDSSIKCLQNWLILIFVLQIIKSTNTHATVPLLSAKINYAIQMCMIIIGHVAMLPEHSAGVVMMDGLVARLEAEESMTKLQPPGSP